MKNSNQQPVKKAALLEIYDSHDVNLYTQLAFLKKGGYDITLIVSQNLKKEVADYNVGQETIFVNCTGKKGFALLKELWKIRSLILKLGIDVVVLNTAHSTPIRNLCLMPFPKSIKFIGNLHGINKLQGSTTQKLISSRVKKYFLLSDYMLEKAEKVPHDGLQFEVYYPMFHPPFTPVPIDEKPAGAIWIGIPGSVEYKRRDYESLIPRFAALKIKPAIRFLILGNGNHAHGNGAELKKLVEEHGVTEYFKFFDGFVPNDLFHAYLQQCDAMMPLIHPINADMEKYLENQISGTFNIAFAYKKPLLMHDYYQRYKDFRENGIFYNLDNLTEVLANLPQLLKDGNAGHYQDPKWGFDFQADRFIQFIESE